MIWCGVSTLFLKKSFFDPIQQILPGNVMRETNGAQQVARERLTQVIQKSQAYQQALKAALRKLSSAESFRSEA